ncbi:longifolia [Stylosanthes scabra]|uniref:Longifolia n=1 Tax=Stylosanthes scabra TaxID=79078 RepID=A0ABU6ZG58_9FABA|nr:longifolia [Stylosanthes scabra]
MSSKKVMTTMKKEENPDLQKQMGCIRGFFHFFDHRHWFLTNNNYNNTSPPGVTNNEAKELNNKMLNAMASNNVKVARENQQFSTESSGTSNSSSSCSSSMSSLEFNRTILSQIRIQENSNSEAAVKQPNTPAHESLDFYDIVKDSMQREPRALSVKTAAKEETKGRILKHIDSPRPLQTPKSATITNEPLHILGRSRRKPWDSPRRSYDEREIQQLLKHKEIPRLSLDSRQGSNKGYNEATRSQNLLKDAETGYESSSTMLRQQQHEPETPKRPSSVVAKLMGLEELPDCTQTCDTPSQMSSISEGYNQHKSPVSPLTSKQSSVISRRDDALIRKATPYSRFSLEPIPWEQPDASQDSDLQVPKGSETSITASNSSHSVYGEIEKRIADLQFKNSGKDLRALKQILEAMQRYKDSLDITRDRETNYPSNKSLTESSKLRSPRQQNNTTVVTDDTTNSPRGRKFPIVIMKPAEISRKPNVATKDMINGKSGCIKFSTDGRLLDKLESQTAKGTSPANPLSQRFHSADKSNMMKTSKLMQASKVPQIINGEKTNNSSHTVETRSPRVQNKFGFERHSPINQSSESRSNRRQHKQSPESLSPSSTPRQKASTLQHRNEAFSKIRCQRRNFKHLVDIISSNVDSNRSIDSQRDIECTQAGHSGSNYSISFQEETNMNHNTTAKELSKESAMATVTVTSEQQSPVSVLDPRFYNEDPPSPIKKKIECSKDLDEALATSDNIGHASDVPLSFNNTKANFRNGTSDDDLQTQNLVQGLRQNDDNNEKFPNCRERKDSDRKYIAEILLASGLLSSPSSIQAVHSPGHIINPKLFFALELFKTNKLQFNMKHNDGNMLRINNPEEMQRKLIFDVVNEILLQKLILESPSPLRCLPNQPEVVDRKLNGRQLLDELCTEIDNLQPKNTNFDLDNEDADLTSLLWGDLMHQPTISTECNTEIPNVVLDIERLIFKDLITEVVRGEVANHPGRYCRQLLFPN